MATAHIDEPPTAMIDRVASLLGAFVGQRPLTLAELARRSNLPRSSAHRILQRLVELGWVERKDFKYALGLRMFELGAQATRQRSVHRAALPVLTDLHRRTGLTAHLSMLTGAEILHLERVGLWPTTGSQWGVGARQPAMRTAAGRAILSALPRAEWPVLDDIEPATPYSLRTPRQLEQDLRRIQDRGGVAVDAQGCVLGVTVVAAAIETGDGDGQFALSLCGPTRTLRLEMAIAEVRGGAAKIWRGAIGAPPPRPRSAGVGSARIPAPV
ncbi:IclR family transcriptional regulator [Nocardia farcinica]|uniref:Transcriptional regulator kdgR n=4 Tax=Nocardia farcinica TaxID=37329 RepID=A0A0H5NG57_NOCFR|nr:IclR family transcriptional regulator [Nocardia farcinica]AXK89238.1 IclR family transcriptional regulator [Nocardia farcinica]PFX03561.1 HTH-type transcriptional regulator KipR [Nocardia farcinica]PFX08711.1 HTH-type transcriptional regulator KipR [Nocardia farcinica]CRY74493.1 Transcriptional regulator kdgR [Nocardia farcinica]SIT31674.1 transcriptional regulator, IclR family [Nocardia farcinica]